MSELNIVISADCKEAISELDGLEKKLQNIKILIDELCVSEAKLNMVVKGNDLAFILNHDRDADRLG